MQRLAWSERSAHAGRFFGLRRALFWLVINRYRIRMCESRRRMNNEISDNNQKIMLKLRVISDTIELVKKLASVRHGLQNYHAVISGCVI